MTRYAIGDIHGGLKTFRSLIDSLDLRHGDTLYTLGDYIDRGPDSRGVLELLMQLRDSGYDVRPLKGNHEDMMLRVLNDDHDDYSKYWMRLWGNETLKSFGTDTVTEVYNRYINFISNLPCCLSDGDFYFVHAGLNLTMKKPLEQTPVAHMLWESSVLPEPIPEDLRPVVSGHKICSVEQIRNSLSNKLIQIDNGAFYLETEHTGNLVALNLDTMQLTFQKWLDEEVEVVSTVYDMSFKPARQETLLIRETEVSHEAYYRGLDPQNVAA